MIDEIKCPTQEYQEFVKQEAKDEQEKLKKEEKLFKFKVKSWILKERHNRRYKCAF